MGHTTLYNYNSDGNVGHTTLYDYNSDRKVDHAALYDHLPVRWVTIYLPIHSGESLFLITSGSLAQSAKRDAKNAKIMCL